MIIEWILCGKSNLQAWIKVHVYGFNPEFLKYPAFAYSAMLPLTLPSEVMFWLNWLDESPILFWINIKSISYPVLHRKPYSTICPHVYTTCHRWWQYRQWWLETRYIYINRTPCRITKIKYKLYSILEIVVATITYILVYFGNIILENVILEIYYLILPYVDLV